MSKLRLSFLGSPQIAHEDQPVVLPRRKSVALLAYLAVTAVPHSREFLATLFWPEFDESRGLAYLRRTLWDINQALGKKWLRTDREQVQLLLTSDVWLDVTAFLALTERPDEESLQQAHALYRGEFLEGFSLRDALDFDDWQYAQRERLHRRYGRCWQRLLGLAVAAGDLETAVAYATHWLSLDTLHEEAHRHLMTLYAHLGQRATAVQQYETCAQILADELGLMPEPATQAFIETIRQGELPPLEPLYVDVVQAVPRRPRLSNLPQFMTPFVGRERELEQIEAFLAKSDGQLLTLVGSGGIGKTRLAVEAARKFEARLSDGVCFVPLAQIGQTNSIPFALAEALELHVDAGDEPMAVVLEFLSAQKLLLILDNFEHLLAGVDWVYELLTKTPDVRLLVTSRQRLALPNEHLVVVPELAYPPNGVTADLLKTYEAVTFFARQASHLRDDFDLDDCETQQNVARICQLVAGHPLALEMAASWVRWLSLADIARELDRSLVRLETMMAEQEARHRSLRAVFEFSWQMLTWEEQEVLPKLAVFQGGFTREAAATLIAFPHSVLAGLIEKSLVHLLGNGRYTLHNVLQEFALEKLHQNPQTAFATQTRHWSYFANFLAQQEPVLRGRQLGVGYQRIHLEFANIRSGWQFALATKQLADMEKALNSLWLYFGEYHSEEGRRLLQQTIEVLRTVEGGVAERLLWKLMTVEIYLIRFYNRKEVVLNYAPAIIAYLRQHPVQDWDMLSFVIVGWAHAYGLIDQIETNRLAEMFIARAKELSDPYYLGRTLQGLGWMNLFLYKPPHLDLAEKFSLESVAVATEHQVLEVQNSAYWQLGAIALQRQEYEQALVYGRLCLAGCQEAGIMGFALVALSVCLRACLALRKLEEAHYFLREALANPRCQPGAWQAATVVYGALKFHQEKRYSEVATIISVYKSQISAEAVPAVLQEMELQLKNELPTAVYQAAQKRGRTLDLEAITQKILFEKVLV